MAFERLIRVHNLQVSGVETYAGHEIAASGFYTIQDEAERSAFASDPFLNVDVWSNPARACINDGIEDLPATEGDSWLKLIDMTPKDAEGSQINKTKVVSQTNYVFQKKSTFFVGATSGQTVFEEDYLGNDQNDAHLKCYDEFGVEVSGAAVSGATETQYDFEPSFNYDLIAGELKTLCVENVSGGIEHGPFDIRDYRAYVIVVPDLPKAFGGSVVLINNEELPTMGERIIGDGRSVKNFAYDPVYHTNKIRVIIKHPKGFSVTVQMVLDLFYDRAEE